MQPLLNSMFYAIFDQKKNTSFHQIAFNALFQGVCIYAHTWAYFHCINVVKYRYTNLYCKTCAVGPRLWPLRGPFCQQQLIRWVVFVGPFLHINRTGLCLSPLSKLEQFGENDRLHLRGAPMDLVRSGSRKEEKNCGRVLKNGGNWPRGCITEDLIRFWASWVSMFSNFPFGRPMILWVNSSLHPVLLSVQPRQGS